MQVSRPGGYLRVNDLNFWCYTLGAQGGGSQGFIISTHTLGTLAETYFSPPPCHLQIKVYQICAETCRNIHRNTRKIYRKKTKSTSPPSAGVGTLRDCIIGCIIGCIIAEECCYHQCNEFCRCSWKLITFLPTTS